MSSAAPLVVPLPSPVAWPPPVFSPPSPMPSPHPPAPPASPGLSAPPPSPPWAWPCLTLWRFLRLALACPSGYLAGAHASNQQPPVVSQRAVVSRESGGGGSGGGPVGSGARGGLRGSRLPATRAAPPRTISCGHARGAARRRWGCRRPCCCAAYSRCQVAHTFPSTDDQGTPSRQTIRQKESKKKRIKPNAGQRWERPQTNARAQTCRRTTIGAVCAGKPRRTTPNHAAPRKQIAMPRQAAARDSLRTRACRWARVWRVLSRDSTASGHAQHINTRVNHATPHHVPALRDHA